MSRCNSGKKQKHAPHTEQTHSLKHPFAKLDDCSNRKRIPKPVSSITTNHNENSLHSYSNTPTHNLTKTQNVGTFLQRHNAQHHSFIKDMLDSCLSEVKYPNNKDNTLTEWQSKIEQMIEDKVQNAVQHIIERNIKKYLTAERETFSQLLRQTETQILRKTNSIEQSYDYILETYDSFLKIVETIKDRPHTRSKELQTAIARNSQQLKKVQEKLSLLSKDTEQLKSINRPPSPTPKIEPMLLHYEQERQQLTHEQLKVVVTTYNENFRQIDQKLKELYCHLT